MKFTERTLQKAEERAEIRNQTNLGDKQWDFLFQAAYQSVDESEDDQPLDPDTDNEDESNPQVKGNRRVWVSHPPTYRADIVSTDGSV